MPSATMYAVGFARELLAQLIGGPSRRRAAMTLSRAGGAAEADVGARRPPKARPVPGEQKPPGG